MASRDFNKNILRLMTGATIAEAIPVAMSPIITRLYSPEDFGIFALFMAVATVLGSIATGRYEFAIVLPEKDEDAINIAALGFLIAIFISISWLIIILVLNENIAHWLGNDGLSFWLYFTPIPIFLSGALNVLRYLNIRMRMYNEIARATVFKAVVGATMQLIFGVFKPGAFGLLASSVVAQVSVNGKLLKNVLSRGLISHVSTRRIKAVGLRYIDFPKYSVWGIFLNQLSQNIMIFFIASTYSVAILGCFSLVQRLFGLTTSVLAQPISQIYFKEASDERVSTGAAVVSFVYFLKRLFITVVPASLVLIFLAKPLITIMFGERWIEAGNFAQILIPYFCCRLLSSPVSITLAIFEKQKFDFLMHFSILMTAISVMLCGKYFHLNARVFLCLFSCTMSFLYLSFILYYWKIAKGTAS